MPTTTALLIVLACIAALGLALFQYYGYFKKGSKLYILLTVLRFLSLLGLFILLINPEFEKTDFVTEKTNLILLTDNSSSMKEYQSTLNSVLNQFRDRQKLKERFELKEYQFGNSLTENNALSLTQKTTNISGALDGLSEIYNGTASAVIMLTDGNQTIGNDYVFQSNTMKQPVFPIVMGDTTKYEDVRVDQVNVNKYAFLKNKFPIEAFVTYQGNQEVKTNATIEMNGRRIYNKTINLSKAKNNVTLNTLVEANSVGVMSIAVKLTDLPDERNKNNNEKNVAIEVIDEKTTIAIVSEVLHPDIGALKKSIETNQQRTVILKKPTDPLSGFEEVDVFLVYQPTRTFKPILDFIGEKKASLFLIAGTKTDWQFLNSRPNRLGIQDGYPVQEVSPVVNPSFSKFDISDFSVEDFPPLDSDAGPVTISNVETLLQMKILGRTAPSPLLLARDNDGKKELVLVGENIWKWRMQCYRNDKNFENFDAFMGKLILYLSANTSKNRLNLDYKRIYDGSTEPKIMATYFDQAFVFDSNASLVIKIKSKEGNFSKELPMLLKDGFYEADLVGLPANEYQFSVHVGGENRSKSGAFTILDFDVEKQLLTADYQKLGQLASNTNGKLFYPSQTYALIRELSSADRFLPTQKSIKNIVSLIDFRILLALIAVSLAAEWFIRKFNGLI
jgi:hypothetical protein